jgi:ligand-binding sensor domain-containing protein/signal transduction histidine kinase
MIKRAIFCIFLLFLANIIWSQNKQMRFRHLDIEDGLSLSSVYTIFQDSKGFMWFGTEDGLNRYDGKNFRIFRPDASNTNSISHKWIDQIYEDKSGLLWFGSRGGLTSFNPQKEIFTQYKNAKEKGKKLSNDTVTCLLEDKEKLLWVGTFSGLNKIDLKTGNSTLFNFKNNNLSGLNERINTLIQVGNDVIMIGTNTGLYSYEVRSDKFSKLELNIEGNASIQIVSMVNGKDRVWLGTNIGLISYFPGTKTTKLHTIPPSHFNSAPNQTIENIFAKNDEEIWVGAVDGLYKFNKPEELFEAYVYAADVSNSQSINPVKPIKEDENGNIWYGTFGEGLYIISKEGQIINYKNNPGDQKSISTNSVNCMYQDRAGLHWLGTFGGGLNIYDPVSHKFDLIKNNPNNINSLSSNFVWSMMEAFDGSIWIGTNSTGISKYHPKTGKFVHYTPNPNDPNSLSNPTIRYIFQDSKGGIWIATDGGGLNKYIPQTNSFKQYRYSTNDSTTISSDYIRGIYEDSKGMLWIGTLNGLNKLNPNNGKFTRFLNNPLNNNSLSHNYIYTGIKEDKNGNLWVGTIGGGLNKLNLENGTFKSYQNIPGDSESLSDNMVFWIYEDNNGYIWVATNSKLCRFNPKTEKFKSFGSKEGLPNEVIYGILPDEDNNIWLSTNYGLCRFNLKDFTTKNYDINDGLQSNEFNGGALHLGKSGKLYFGGVYGLNIIDPKKLKVTKNKTEIVISKLGVFGKEVQVVDPEKLEILKNDLYEVVEKNDQYFFHESVSYTKKIVLDYDHNFFSLEFAALNTSLPDKVQYAYRMENLDKGWNYSGSRNFVSYVRLKPGNYTFRVKAQNADGLWSESITELKIKIKYPFWQSWWFIALEIFITFNLFMLIYRYLLKSKTNKLLKAQNEEISKVNLQLSESEKNLKELNATKDKFFSIISHDLKNPFSSLLSMSESVSENFQHFDEEDKLTVFNKIHESVKHIYSLLNNLLTWSRAQQAKHDFVPVEFNLSKLIEINTNLNKLAAEKKGIKILTDYDENIKAFADMQMINTVLRNLINNAVKFSAKGDTIEIVAKKENSHIEISVKDQGTGISEENQKKLFRIDVKYKSTGTSGEKGTGLGLILCKEFVEKNMGQIKVESVLGKGSIFTFTVPTKSFI